MGFNLKFGDFMGSLMQASEAKWRFEPRGGYAPQSAGENGKGILPGLFSVFSEELQREISG